MPLDPVSLIIGLVVGVFIADTYRDRQARKAQERELG